MGKPKWMGEDDLANFKAKDIDELVGLYPKYTKNYLYTLKKQYGGSMEKEGKLAKTWEVSAFDREANEWTTTINHSYDHTEGAESFEPAQPAKITPSRRKPVTRPYKRLFVFSDAQIDYRRLDSGELEPLHDERAIRVGSLKCWTKRSVEVVTIGFKSRQ